MTTDKEKLDAIIDAIKWTLGGDKITKLNNDRIDTLAAYARKWQLLCEIPSNEDVDIYTRDQAAELIQSIEEQTND